MKIILISTVTAAFLVYSVTAEGNRPTRLTEVTRGRDQERLLVPPDGNPTNLRRHPSTFRATRSPRKSRILLTLRQGKPFTLSGGSSQTLKRTFAGKSEHVRRSLIHGPNKFDAVLLEPAFQLAPKQGLLSHMFGKRYESLGPLIGPLKMSGIGEKVYVRLLEPSDNEAADHVTVHVLIAGKTAEIVNEIHDSTDFGHPRNIEPCVDCPGRPKFPKFSTFPKIRPRRPIVSSSLTFNRRPVAEQPPHRPGNVPFFKVESPDFVGNVKHRTVPKQSIQSLANIRPAEHLVAPNHHKLPVAQWPMENLSDLPIYPPLSLGKSKEVDDNGSEVKTFQVNTGVADGGKQTDSSNRTIVQLRDNSDPGEVKQQSVNLSMNREEEMKIRRKFVEPVFVDKVPGRDLGFDRQVSSPTSILGVADTAENHFIKRAVVPTEEQWRGFK